MFEMRYRLKNETPPPLMICITSNLKFDTVIVNTIHVKMKSIKQMKGNILKLVFIIIEKQNNGLKYFDMINVCCSSPYTK